MCILESLLFYCLFSWFVINGWPDTTNILPPCRVMPTQTGILKFIVGTGLHKGYIKVKMDYNLCAPQGNGNLGNLLTKTLSFDLGHHTTVSSGYIALNDNVIMCASTVSGQFFGVPSSKCV